MVRVHIYEIDTMVSGQYIFQHQGEPMNLVRLVFLGLAVLLPATWTVAKAEDAPAGDTTTTKTTKKTKKSKKNADGSGKTESDTKTETKTDK
jgi:hypothetical protein